MAATPFDIRNSVTFNASPSIMLQVKFVVPPAASASGNNIMYNVT